ncbi:MAG: hemolysin III family protein, partial [Clostridia bacterium]|nr:hemolysin III family protein [Clostridia bacterium]
VVMILMLIRADGGAEVAGAIIYSLGLLIMFSMSTLYHAFRHGSAVKRLFRRFDYSCIYLLIGATFAPILLGYIGGAYGYGFFIVQWSVIAFGITLVAVFTPHRFRPVHLSLYFILGWSGLMFLPRMIEAGDIAFLWYILGGGIIYSLGIIPFAIKPRFAHTVWHLFVLGGALVQWIGIYTQIYLT